MKIFDLPLPFYAADADAGGGDKQVEDGADKSGAGADAGAGAGDADKGGDKAADKGGDKAGSFLDSADDAAGDADKKIIAPVDWPEDWRDKMAAGDEAMRKRLDRFKAPGDVFKSYTELEGKFKKGAPASDEPMPDPEKDPEKAKEWRQARGIPDDPTGYDVPEAVKALVTDADKPRLAEYTEHMHKAGVPKQAAQAAMEWYFQTQVAGQEAIAAADKADQSEVEDALRSEWGSDFRANSTVAKRFAEEITPGINWFGARLPDGRMLGNIPEFVKALSNLGTKEYGDVSFAGGEAANRTVARKEELETMMANDPDAYHANPKFTKEYEAIMEAELRAKGSDRGLRHSPKP